MTMIASGQGVAWQAPILPAVEIPPLESGDRLSRDEFERRQNAMPRCGKVELIEGVVYMNAIRYRKHGLPNKLVFSWLNHYELRTPGICSCFNISVRLDEKNLPEPDAALFIEPERGGQLRVSDDDYLTGAPELAAEVTASTVSYDLGDKLEAYRRNGVREYVVWRVLDRAIDWLVLRGDQYVVLAPSSDGILRSENFPGLWLDVEAMLRGDMLAVLATLETGLATPEHAEFAARLKGSP